MDSNYTSLSGEANHTIQIDSKSNGQQFLSLVGESKGGESKEEKHQSISETKEVKQQRPNPKAKEIPNLRTKEIPNLRTKEIRLSIPEDWSIGIVNDVETGRCTLVRDYRQRGANNNTDDLSGEAKNSDDKIIRKIGPMMDEVDDAENGNRAKYRNKNQNYQSYQSNGICIGMITTMVILLSANFGFIIADLIEYGFQHFRATGWRSLDVYINPGDQSGWLLCQITFVFMIDALLILVADNRRVYNYVNFGGYLQFFTFARLLFVATATAINWQMIVACEFHRDATCKVLYADGLLLAISSLIFFGFLFCSVTGCRRRL